MPSPLRIVSTLFALALVSTGLRAAEPDPYANLGKAADNKIFAQTIVNDIMASHSELVVIGIHTIAPGSKDETMIATNLDRIGKKDDDDDIAVATERKTICAPNLKDATRFEVQVPLMDKGGNVIGAIGLVFKYKAGDDEVVLHKKALKIRKEIADRLMSKDDLFKTS